MPETKTATKKTATKKTPSVSTKLRYSTHTITGTVPPIKAMTVFDPSDHTMFDGSSVADKMQEFEGRGLIKKPSQGAKAGDKVSTSSRK